MASVPTPPTTADRLAPPPLKALIAVSDDDPSTDAVDFARRHLPLDADITVLTVAGHEPALGRPVPAAMTPPQMATAFDAERSGPRRAVELAEQAADQLPQEADAAVAPGDPAVAICAAAEEIGADLIVVGTHDRSAWARLWYGSVARHVASNAPCSVLVVR